MAIGHRSDGTRAEGLGFLRQMLPYLMPTRNEAFVLFAQQIEAAPGQAFLEHFNRARAFSAKARFDLDAPVFARKLRCDPAESRIRID